MSPEALRYAHCSKALLCERDLRYLTFLSMLANQSDADAKPAFRSVWHDRLQNDEVKIGFAWVVGKCVGFVAVEGSTVIDYYLHPEAEAVGVGNLLFEHVGYEPPVAVETIEMPVSELHPTGAVV